MDIPEIEVLTSPPVLRVAFVAAAAFVGYNICTGVRDIARVIQRRNAEEPSAALPSPPPPPPPPPLPKPLVWAKLAAGYYVTERTTHVFYVAERHPADWLVTERVVTSSGIFRISRTMQASCLAEAKSIAREWNAVSGGQGQMSLVGAGM